MQARTERDLLTALSLILLAVCLPAGAVHAEDPADALALTVRTLLDRVDAEEDVDRVARQLGSLGPDAVPILCLAYRDGIGDLRKVLPQNALLRSFRPLPEADLHAYLRSQAIGDVTADRRISSIRIVGAAGHGSSMGPLLEIASDLPPELRRSPATPGCVRGAMVRLMGDGEAGYRALKAGWVQLEPALRGIAIDAAEDVGSREALRFLVGLLGSDPGTEATILTRISRMPVSGFGALDSSEVAKVGKALHRQSPGTRRAAAFAVGRLHHVRSFERLLELMEDEDEKVREAALWAARRMSGARFGIDRERWTAWLASERQWLEHDCRLEIKALYAGGVERALEALDRLGKRRLFRESFLRDVLPALVDADSGIRAGTCVSLGLLGTPSAIPDLLRSGEDRDETVRSAATAALLAVTGLASIPADTEARKRLFVEGPGPARRESSY
ncbi:MAG: HEAT repeat domain-containing protein [Planctomycetota bacterium]|jgi:hypothetical protein